MSVTPTPAAIYKLFMFEAKPFSIYNLSVSIYNLSVSIYNSTVSIHIVSSREISSLTTVNKHIRSTG